MKKFIYSLLIILAVVCASAQSTTTSYTRTLKFFSSDLLQMYEGARIAAPTMTLPNSLTTYTSTLPFGNSDNRQLYNAIRGIGDAVSSGTTNSWNLTGNSVSTNTNFIGTTNNRPFTLKTNSLTAVTVNTNQTTVFSKSLSLNIDPLSNPSPNNIFEVFSNSEELIFKCTENSATPLIELGDVGGGFNGTKITVNDFDQQITLNGVTNINRSLFIGQTASNTAQTPLTLYTNTANTEYIFKETDGTIIGADYINPSVGTGSLYAGRWVGTATNDNLHLFTNGNGGGVPALTVCKVQSGNYPIVINGNTSYTSTANLRVNQGALTNLIETEGTAGNITWYLQKGTNTVNQANKGTCVIGSTVIAANQPTLLVIGTHSVSSTTTLTGLRNNATFTSTGAAMIGGTTAGSATLHVLGTFSASSSGTLAGVLSTSSVVSTSKTAGIGYAVGSGSTVTQGTSRTTGVTINDVVGSITLFSAAGSTTYQDFTVTNSTVGINDVIIINQRSGTDRYEVFITAVAAGSFRVTFATTGGTTVESPVFNFAVIKGATN
jgi:hypothetical protein